MKDFSVGGQLVRVINVIEGYGSTYKVGDVLTVDHVETRDSGKDVIYVREVSEPVFTSEVEVVLDESVMHDVVSSPSHYVNSGIEPIAYMADKLPAYDDGFVAFCMGNVLKYVSRAPHKHETPLEDMRKARQYLDFAIAHEENKLD